ncbi:MAG TPA: hypothetical protein VNN08_06180 [Thermoanaerobaculia bacterium]|nr:hypothetical protein [Thermoanaerobaculia bacterium]
MSVARGGGISTLAATSPSSSSEDSCSVWSDRCFELRTTQQAAIVASVVLLAAAMAFPHRRVKARKLPPAARGFVDQATHAQRRRLAHVDLGPVTCFLMLQSLLCLAGLFLERTAAPP